MESISQHHIESFNFACEEGLNKLIEDIPAFDFQLPDLSICTFKIEDANISTPIYKSFTKSNKIMPRDCRQMRSTYGAELKINISWHINGLYNGSLSKVIGLLPMMIKSNHCHLSKIHKEEELIKLDEEFSEFGGYFIINGIEKLIRPILIPRRNFPIALIRPTWKKNGICYTEYGLVYNSVRNEHTYSNMIMHYLNNGSIVVSLFFQNQKFTLPLIPILKALSNKTDKRLYTELVKGQPIYETSVSSSGEKDIHKFYKSCVLNMLRKYSLTLHNSSTIPTSFKNKLKFEELMPPRTKERNERDKALSLIGSQFRNKILPVTPNQFNKVNLLNPVNIRRHIKAKKILDSRENKENLESDFDLNTLDPVSMKDLEDEIVGKYLLDNALLLNFDSDMDKFYMLIYMTQKIFSFAKNKCWPEHVDGPSMQEVLLPGQVFLILLKQKLMDYIFRLKQILLKKVENIHPTLYDKRLSKKWVKAETQDVKTETLDIKTEPDNKTLNIKPEPKILQKTNGNASIYQELITNEFVSQCLSLVSPITKGMEYFFSTGNLIFKEATSIQQTSGYTIIAEKINYARYLSHFRSVHRGSHMAKTRISSIRKLSPDSWGYLCAVHTPDGAPCGLLNHFTSLCKVVSSPTYFKSSHSSLFDENDRKKYVKFEIEHSNNSPHNDSREQGATSPILTYEEFDSRCTIAVKNVMFVKREKKEKDFSPFPFSTGKCKTPEDSLGPEYHYPLFLNGRMMGWVPEQLASCLEERLRYSKSMSTDTFDTNLCGESNDSVKKQHHQSLIELPPNLEIVFIPNLEINGQYPGFFLFSTFSRMVRPIKNLRTLRMEYIGSFEQIYLHIAIQDSEIKEETRHQELCQTAFLSITANLIPFSDFNQSPRNMYQCQMCKQTMGTTHYTLPFRAENKSYRLQTPQAPLVKPIKAHSIHHIDDYPSGTNAIVAVLAYTGYDMEDAMVINKHSEERGFAHGYTYKTDILNVSDIVTDTLMSVKESRESADMTTGSLAHEETLHIKAKHKECLYSFGFDPHNCINYSASKESNIDMSFPIDPDGLPYIGAIISEGTPYYSYINTLTGKCKVIRHKGSETFTVDRVYIMGQKAEFSNKDGGEIMDSGGIKKALIYIRIRRNPSIGDKFASRQGQKGICSFKIRHENLPFTESGIVPDIIFNPHGFPSRMTIGMIIECMAGKSASLNGEIYDATPFTFNEKRQASHHFSQLLSEAGYDYYGTELMYSGVEGRMLEVDIFMGIIYYQRLRHMVADKYQVRTTGPVDSLTHQPLKGRKRGGGIRCGEMERDALISHGTTFLLQDRLLNCSDICTVPICPNCKSLITTSLELSTQQRRELINNNSSIKRKKSFLDSGNDFNKPATLKCKICQAKPVMVKIPYVLKYLTYELMALNLKLEIELKDIC
ncbi:unnamed protein product [Gordionus sp. m RMFG-2023]|uniref:DNA-directed RNA polymerase I subunit RPA2-like n=1 Tax=Gordionus sp. m RMFG-2023 TaxID=3053472 RepID=UPI0030E230EC